MQHRQWALASYSPHFSHLRHSFALSVSSLQDLQAQLARAWKERAGLHDPMPPWSHSNRFPSLTPALHLAAFSRLLSLQTSHLRPSGTSAHPARAWPTTATCPATTPPSTPRRTTSRTLTSTVGLRGPSLWEQGCSGGSAVGWPWRGVQWAWQDRSENTQYILRQLEHLPASRRCLIWVTQILSQRHGSASHASHLSLTTRTDTLFPTGTIDESSPSQSSPPCPFGLQNPELIASH